jgi:hypothetical protein
MECVARFVAVHAMVLPAAAVCQRVSSMNVVLQACRYQLPPARRHDRMANVSSSLFPWGQAGRAAPVSDQTEDWASSFVRHSCEPAPRGTTTKTEEHPLPTCSSAASKTCAIVRVLEPAMCQLTVFVR